MVLIPSLCFAENKETVTPYDPFELSSKPSAKTIHGWFDKGAEYSKRGAHKDAFHWFKKAADQGYATAQFNLGKKYAKGEGVLQD